MKKISKHIHLSYRHKSGGPYGQDTIYRMVKKQDAKNSCPVEYRLSYSRLDNTWASQVKNKIAVKAVDDGDGYTVSFNNGPTFRLNYAQVSQLSLILREDRIDSNWVTKIVEFKKTKK